MAPILIQPDNRLLGWPATDLSLYGAQPLPGMMIGPAAEARVQGEAAEQKAPAAPSDNGAAVASAPAADPAAPVAAVPAAPTALAPESAPAAPTALAPDSEHIAIAPGATLPAADTASPPGPAVLPAPAESVQPDAASPMTSGTHAALTAPLVAATDVADPILGQVVSGAAIDTASAALGHVTDMLDGIAGLDPVAGIGTIVDLMKTADIFELRATSGDVLDHGMPPILDALTFDIADESPLLGDLDAHHGDDGLLGGIDTHHGLPGLG